MDVTGVLLLSSLILDLTTALTCDVDVEGQVICQFNFGS